MGSSGLNGNCRAVIIKDRRKSERRTVDVLRRCTRILCRRLHVDFSREIARLVVVTTSCEVPVVLLGHFRSDLVVLVVIDVGA